MQLRVDRLWNGAPAHEGEAVHVALRRGVDGLWVAIDAPLHGDPLPDVPTGAMDGLWAFEVVEVFIAGSGDPVPYTEVEVGPGGHYLALTLSGIRSATARVLPLDVRVTRDGARWEAVIHVPSALLPPPPWRVNANAIHGVGEARRYLSSCPLPGDAPDFHQPDAFIPWEDAPTPGTRPGA